jgi:molybdate transport system ATP-binding protein
MTLAVDVEKHVGKFSLTARFASTGRVTALFGRSGAGKTTLVNLIAGLIRPDRGVIAADGDVLVDTDAGTWIPAHRRRVGYVFQEGRLFPHLSVKGNLLYGRRLTARTRRWGSVETIVDLLGIGHLLDRRPGGLSGGEKQRVAIGRALLASPRLLLMDEPLASLDEARKADLLPYIERLRDSMRLPIVYVSHAIDEVARIADTLVLVDAGTVVATGPVNDILARADLRPLTGQQEASVVLTLRVAGPGADPDITVLEHPAGRLSVPRLHQPAGTEVRLRVRARDVALAVGALGNLSIRNRLAATVTAIAGGAPPMVEVSLDAAGMPLIAEITRGAARSLDIRPGQAVTALIKSAAFDRMSFGPAAGAATKI